MNSSESWIVTVMLPQKQDPIIEEVKRDAGWSFGLADICDVMANKVLLRRDDEDVT